MLRRPRFLRALHVAALCVPLLAACSLGDAVGPGEIPEHLPGLYRLVSVSGNPLPADVGFSLGVPERTEFVAGAVELTGDATFVDASLFRIYHPDRVNYDEYNLSAQGSVRSHPDGIVEFRPYGASAYAMRYDASTDVPALEQEWGAYVLRYERQPAAEAP